MNDNANRALLPTGLRDVLPPDAAFEADVVHRLMAHFAAHGYDRVKPPLIEFEESLLVGGGAGSAAQTFRVMDPLAHRMMGVRPDMTLQIARIATTRLGSAPRPLRLSYAGQVLRVKGSQLRPERQFGQAGLELIGSDAPTADVEVILLAMRGLEALGVGDISIDLSLPPLVATICAGLGLGGEAAARLRDALDHKDAAAVAQLGGAAAGLLGELLRAVGPAEAGLARLAALPLPQPAARERDRLAEVARLLREAAPDIRMTLDPVENRGFEYYTGICFTIFSRRATGELGRGGRYMPGRREPATGATLFLDAVIGALAGPPPAKRAFLPLGTPAGLGAELRRRGWVTVAGLEAVADIRSEARRLGCGHVIIDGELAAAEETKKGKDDQ